ncbi:uncharacterized protein LOC128397703 [Panonychus citri]|uniref:uncharacterized protein LOC128396359 n=1 Tax=Panonychus citri TaxID=50023 RepID=UPI002307703B|nr:uncharacterized protein LOC128396359 [Panonychus citri]XP_053214421.1 uncharacterized protein LOC128397703 [Panonychus citri]
MPVDVLVNRNNNDHGNDNIEQIDPQGVLNNYQRHDVSSGGDRNVLSTSNVRQSSVSTNLDEEIIRRRGKRERKSHIITRSMNPIILATRKSPIKRPRDNSVTLEMLKIFGDLSKSPSKRTPVKRLRTSPPSSPGMMTRKRLNMSCDSGIGSPSSSPSTTNGTRSSSNNKKTPVNAPSRARRSRARRNLRRLS